MTAILSSVLGAIGRTPLVRLRAVVPPGSAQVLVKLEGANPSGSYKDRMALSIVEAAEQRGDLARGRRIVEFTGGSTGSSLAMICAVKGIPLTLVSSDAFSPEKLRTMTAFGAELVLVESDGGVITPGLFDRMRAEVERIVERDGAYWTDQFHNTDALIGYAELGREVIAQTDGRVDVFCAAVGSAGMLVGAARPLRAALGTRVVAFEPATAPMLTAGHSGPHRVEGTATGIVPPLLGAADYDEARVVDEVQARALAIRLAREDGVFAGTSSALNIQGALDLAAELEPDRTVVTVAVDTGLKYLAGDLFTG